MAADCIVNETGVGLAIVFDVPTTTSFAREAPEKVTLCNEFIREKSLDAYFVVVAFHYVIFVTLKDVSNHRRFC